VPILPVWEPFIFNHFIPSIVFHSILSSSKTFGIIFSYTMIVKYSKIDNMKKVSVIYMIGVSVLLTVLTACNNTTSKEDTAKQVTRVNDSLQLDSFKRVEAAKTA